MPRNMSFALTTPQFRARTKTVTRRLGWWWLEPGELIMGVEKGMGLRKGETVTRLALIRVVSAQSERLDAITQGDVAREGFADLSRAEFVDMFCRHNRCAPKTTVNRIEFEYV